ncbi:hypothetical protein BU15DRAFT_75078 [Melanogaster broomeanus]|nr:hypothetical protein BU15DRAFT_75078 [Melanogaster broomeanus]
MRLRTKPEEAEAGGALTARGGEGQAHSGGLKDGEWVQRLWHDHHHDVRISNSTTYRDNPNPTLKRSPSTSKHNYGPSSARRSESHPSRLFAHLLILLRAYVFASMTGRLVNWGAHVSMFPSPSSDILAKAASSSTSASLSMEAHTTSKSALAEAQARIDNEIALLKLPICALLTRRNALLPVSRLPYEILATIFLYQAYSFYQGTQYSGMWNTPPWANVSYVCCHWRDVALNTPSLWSFLCMSSPRWTEELLSRSKTAPLRIRVDRKYWQYRALHLAPQQETVFLEKVTTDVTRIQDLSLELPRDLAKLVFANLSASALLLHTFQRHQPFEPWSSPLPHSMVLSDLHCSYNSQAKRYCPSSQPTMTELLAMLRHMPDLAHLYLENTLSSAKDTLASQHTLLSESLDLPHLSRLALAAPFSAVVVFLSNVTIPLKTEIRLFCRGNISFTGSYAPLYPLLEQRFSTTSEVGPVIRTLNIKTTSSDVGFVLSTSERDCDVPFYSQFGRHCHEDWDRGVSLKLDIEFESVSPGDLEQLMGNICRTIPMTHLRTLAHLASIDTSWPLSSCFLKTTFGTLQELRFIKLTKLHMSPWATALSPGRCHGGHGVENAADIFASSLTELQVTDVIFKISLSLQVLGVLRRRYVVSSQSTRPSQS